MVPAMVMQTPSALCSATQSSSCWASSSSPWSSYAISGSRVCSPAPSCTKCSNIGARYSSASVIFSRDIMVGQCRVVPRTSASKRVPLHPCAAHASSQSPKDDGETANSLTLVLQKCALYLAIAAAIGLPLSHTPVTSAFERGPVIPDIGILIAGPPIKDANALLRYALPIANKPIKEVQKTLEEVTDDLKVPGEKAFGSVERATRQAARILNQNKAAILADIAETKKEEGQQLLDKLSEGLQEFNKIEDAKDRAAVAPKQKELLQIVGNIEEAMVEKFPFEVPEEFASKPLLKGRATVEMKVRVKDNPNIKSALLEIVVDGYNAPVTAGNFLDLVERHFYDGMEIQRADGFVVQTGDPDGPAEGFVDPSTGKIRTVPLEIMVDGDKEPIYGATLEELGRYKARTKLPFNAFGTLAMARDEFENDSASSQVFWLLKESELTPSSANILDGRYTVFGYVTDNPDLLADLKVGDVIESIRVTNGIDNLVNPSYKVVA